MKFSIYHSNITVLDLEKSLDFYKRALDFELMEMTEAEDGSFKIAFLAADPDSPCQLELTWYRDRAEPYNLGDNEIHIGFRTDDYEKAHARHKEMDCICFENPEMGIYFIADPDGYWMEIVPVR